MSNIEKAIVNLEFQCNALENAIVKDRANGKREDLIQWSYGAHLSANRLAIKALEKQINDRWILVSEKPPETNKDVLITFREYMEWNKKYRYGTCKAVYISAHSIKTDDMWSYCDNDELSIYDENENEYYVKEGWYEVIEHWDDYSNVLINCEVTAWKPLPEPYKEVEE